MTLAMTLGMTVGIKRTLWMMCGELLGVGLVCVAAVVGVASMMLHYPLLFVMLKYGGGAYLIWLGIYLWRSKGKMAIEENGKLPHDTNRITLALQGFITAVANPKAWAFMVSLFPPFINPNNALFPQLVMLISIILVIEFVCLVMYAGGGKTLRVFLRSGSGVRLLNRIAGTLMIFIGLWLAFD